jgi:hypothetical protein
VVFAALPGRPGVQAARVAAERIPGVRGVEDHTEPFPVVPRL